ncbi:hypothetical protein SO802_008861 [Lithocarpus litseifolius]|uniref:RNase H type-1 domain-containing protein n=1 Tax=Lithocarpus litseifolius TaxID=425828 RepID=A0AAW2DCM7_9ROSI
MGALEVEARAYEAGVLLARHLGLKNGVLEGDSVIVSNAFKQVSQTPTSVAAIVEGIHILSSDIGVVDYSHVRRTGNKPAHILARQAQSFVNDVIWIEDIPCCIQQALIHDAQRSNPDFDSNNSNISSCCSFMNFIMESYYEKHGKLLDSDFQDFIAQADFAHWTMIGLGKEHCGLYFPQQDFKQDMLFLLYILVLLMLGIIV